MKNQMLLKKRGGRSFRHPDDTYHTQILEPVF